jgi:hypothetical protein
MPLARRGLPPPLVSSPPDIDAPQGKGVELDFLAKVGDRRPHQPYGKSQRKPLHAGGIQVLPRANTALSASC